MKNKVALITGGAKRIGADIIRTLHRDGFDIALHYCSSSESAHQLIEELNRQRKESAQCFSANLNELDSVNHLANSVMAHFGQLDVLINNASRFYPTPLGSITGFQWDDLINSNVKGALFLSQSLIEPLRKRSGCIINIVDIHAEKPLKNHTVYSIAKAALAMMTLSLAKELGPEIRVNGISPGAILWPEQTMNDQQKMDILNQIPLNTTGQPSDISKTVLFLVNNAPYITGQILAVDGGRSLNR